ncbi:mitochondrial ATP synthase epsilon chain-domain-containing protein [Piptocephalis cylindrospora]|uniref:Mitochondrial ATP synthase epsilon chain-domain-containing protein n=1 Tax=Piptocephalis cylindrospora TaxID=1907219 RepID=A0A4P9Y7Z2_9FUNG|nr:mitochondrial ATP synthase epsilon chain-domain-containing protein [Piptocephalis cylindrospora]|eukprot:RKP15276.1 mitochondrial ATP synthase epsilon chain-domain-containing protein [Piptocephalis cylindrospora]
MAFSWKTAKITYLQYSQICARAVRSALKEEGRAAAQQRNSQILKVAKWHNGKAGEFNQLGARK